MCVFEREREGERIYNMSEKEGYCVRVGKRESVCEREREKREWEIE